MKCSVTTDFPKSRLSMPSRAHTATIDGAVQSLIEVKAIGLEVKDQHMKQAVDYAAKSRRGLGCTHQRSSLASLQRHRCEANRSRVGIEIRLLRAQSTEPD